MLIRRRRIAQAEDNGGSFLGIPLRLQLICVPGRIKGAERTHSDHQKDERDDKDDACCDRLVFCFLSVCHNNLIFPYYIVFPIVPNPVGIVNGFRAQS